jgi:hypothetical protein
MLPAALPDLPDLPDLPPIMRKLTVIQGGKA